MLNWFCHASQNSNPVFEILSCKPIWANSILALFMLHNWGINKRNHCNTFIINLKWSLILSIHDNEAIEIALVPVGLRSLLSLPAHYLRQKSRFNVFVRVNLISCKNNTWDVNTTPNLIMVFSLQRVNNEFKRISLNLI